jgi:hypothetical protein
VICAACNEPSESEQCPACLAEEVNKGDDGDMRTIYAEALIESEGDYALATVIAMTRWMERGR